MNTPHSHSGSTKAKNQCCVLLATKQAISVQLATTVGHFLCDLDLDFANNYMAVHLVLSVECLKCMYMTNHYVPTGLHKRGKKG